MDCAIDLISSSLPAWVGWPSKANNLLVSLTWRFWYFPFVILPSEVGSPKYFSSKPKEVTCKVFITEVTMACGHASPNSKEHFSWFISCPVAFSYIISKIWLTWVACWSVALKKRKYHPQTASGIYKGPFSWFSKGRYVLLQCFYQLEQRDRQRRRETNKGIMDHIF